MSGFTEEALTRPLFMGPPPDIARLTLTTTSLCGALISRVARIDGRMLEEGAAA